MKNQWKLYIAIETKILIEQNYNYSFRILSDLLVFAKFEIWDELAFKGLEQKNTDGHGCLLILEAHKLGLGLDEL